MSFYIFDIVTFPFERVRTIQSLIFAWNYPNLDDSDEETSSSSSADVRSTIPRRSKFDDEEDDSDVNFRFDSMLLALNRL